MRTASGNRPVRLRSVFISDVHLGSKDSRAGELLKFLASVEVDYLFLVGDIIDFWSLRKSFYWPQQHSDVLRAILGKARDGAQVIYIPGNHDEDMREFCGSRVRQPADPSAVRAHHRRRARAAGDARRRIRRGRQMQPLAGAGSAAAPTRSRCC